MRSTCWLGLALIATVAQTSGAQESLESKRIVVDTVGYSSQRFAMFQEGAATIQQAAPQLQVGTAAPDAEDPAPRPPVTKDMSPIAVSALKVPNISVKGVGTGALPENRTEGRLPQARPLPTGTTREIGMYAMSKEWYAPGFCHKPLYFQDTMLERHGVSRRPCIQPLASGVRFFGTLPIMPYLMTLHPPGEDIYSLGHYRPGSAAPCLWERPPYDRHAMAVQAGSTAGVFVGFPVQ